ncbi:divergent polysaccharide deacetylase family protein [Marinomonas polaris]|uniref:divergent polysaccharide deacetylase family protein n=1 Tax=Marinomonas polaris TaxID=293552 RepID=UPI001FE5E56B|nr:divergent polysaccharide deacetylase family protein [Marinomonas polaris]
MFVFCLHALLGCADELSRTLDRSEDVVTSNVEIAVLEDDQITEKDNETFFEEPVVLPVHLGPLLAPQKKEATNASSYSIGSYFPVLSDDAVASDSAVSASSSQSQSLLETAEPWSPAIVPFLDAPIDHESKSVNPLTKAEQAHESSKKEVVPAKKLAVDSHPKMPRIAILIDDLGYNRQGMDSSLMLPTEVALAILPSTPFATQTALTAQKQKRITLLHAPMENQRELKLGPGGLYAKMTEHELKATLSKDLDGLPGIQGVNNHMGSLLTTKADSMKWVMETLKGRSLFFIDSLTSPKSVAKKTAQEYGLETVSRDVFLDNIRTEQAIDKQFSRLLKLARQHGSALAIGHPYPETMAYLKKRLNHLEQDGVRLVRLSDLLTTSPSVLTPSEQ